MTREQAKAIFPDATDEQIKSLMKANGDDIENAKKNKIADTEIQALKEKAKAYDVSQANLLTNEEKTKQILLDAESLKTENFKILNRTKAIGILVAGGIKEDEYTNILDGMVTDNEEQTIALATNVVNLITKQKETAITSYKETALKQTPSPIGNADGAKGKTFAREDIENMTTEEINKNWVDIQKGEIK